VVSIKVAGVTGKDVLVKTTLYYGDRNIKITTESSHSIPPTQEVVIDFTQVRELCFLGVQTINIQVTACDWMYHDVWATENYLSNSLLKEQEAIDYSELLLDTNPNATDVEEEDMSCFFKQIQKPKIISVPTDESVVCLALSLSMYSCFLLSL